MPAQSSRSAIDRVRFCVSVRSHVSPGPLPRRSHSAPREHPSRRPGDGLHREAKRSLPRATAILWASNEARRSPARQTPSGSCARSRSTSGAAGGSIRAVPAALASWAAEFLSLARRLSPTTQETYRRDLERYVLPRFGSYRFGRLPADEIENWLNDEVASGLAPSSVSPPLPRPAPGAPGGR